MSARGKNDRYLLEVVSEDRAHCRPAAAIKGVDGRFQIAILR